MADELAGWGLEFDKELVKFQGRVLPAEPILLKDRSGRQMTKSSYDPRKADWSREMRDKVIDLLIGAMFNFKT